MKIRTCDFCKCEIPYGEGFIKLYKVGYSKCEDTGKIYKNYTDKPLGDVCIKCLNKLEVKK